MSFEEWVATVPERVKAEACWRFEAYPKTLYVYELAWDDCETLMRDRRGRAVAQQLIRSVGSISANLEEGYGRGVGSKEYLYFLRIAEGSARESKGWYFLHYLYSSFLLLPSCSFSIPGGGISWQLSST